MLCSNRREGFGPHSHLSSPLPTTCFTDVIIIPLPVWLSLALLPLLLILSLHHRKQNFNPSTAHLRSIRSRSCPYTITSTIYYLLIIANILMETLEIVRISLIHFGIGLLPFAYVGLILGGVLHWTEGLKGRVRGWAVINYILWVGGTVVCVVKVVGLDKEGINGRKGSKYPVSDQVIDVAVMAGVYAVIGVLEIVTGVWKGVRRSRGEHGRERGMDGLEGEGMVESLGSRSPVIGEQGEFIGKYPQNG